MICVGLRLSSLLEKLFCPHEASPLTPRSLTLFLSIVEAAHREENAQQWELSGWFFRVLSVSEGVVGITCHPGHHAEDFRSSLWTHNQSGPTAHSCPQGL